ncbi:hypothetical protein BKA62DRAFT_770616 [Auriculariales sp. MPI-PUGE-AT-0066]|nr:hypothetical protein BKA62DRAFT_770616 [Auriculariales sp. MPI-PUGE-AT-0066]
MSDDLLDSRDGARTPTSDAFRSLLRDTWNMYTRERRLGAVAELAQSQRDTAVSAFEELQQISGKINREVQVWREGYDTKCKAVEVLEAELAACKKRLDDIHNSLVVCLIDGDGTIFAPEYLSDGQQGGRRAAQALNAGLLEYLNSDGVRSGIRIIVNLYVNKLGLRTTLARANVCSIQQYDSFWDGFQATSLFSIIDVGQSKEAADAKIRDTLDLYARMPQVSRVFLGAAHDGGYHAPLSGLQLDGLIEKIVLLRGYNEEIAKDLRKLALKEAQLSGLFMAKRIDNNALPTSSRVETPINGPSTQQQHLTAIPSSLSLSFGKPCYMYYLRKTCAFGDRCIYEHHRSFTEAELARLQTAASGMPCAALIHGRPCPLGAANCPMQHKCRFLQQCFHLKNGNCRWSAPSMHDPESAPEIHDTTGAPATVVQPITPPTIPSPKILPAPTNSPPARKRYLVCLLDGHKYIMSHTMMNAGRKGGLDAARKIETAVREHAGPSAAEAAVAVIVFGDMTYLKETLPKMKACSPAQLEAFWAGFKEHSDEFGLLDVESNQIPNRFNELLLAYARRQAIPQVYLAIDGTAYSHSVVRVLIQEGHADKLVLIRASDQPRSELTDLTLTELRVKGLFVKPNHPLRTTSSLFFSTMPVSPPRSGFSEWLAEVQVPTAPDRHTSLESLSTQQAEQLRVDKPPCNYHYVLGNCTVGESACTYSHTKIFTAADIQKLQRLAKTSPCLFANKGKPCPHGDERCCMLHRCPSGPTCSRFLAGAWCPKMHAP